AGMPLASIRGVAAALDGADPAGGAGGLRGRIRIASDRPDALAALLVGADGRRVRSGPLPLPAELDMLEPAVIAVDPAGLAIGVGGARPPDASAPPSDEGREPPFLVARIGAALLEDLPA